jgi:hypothetical protein
MAACKLSYAVPWMGPLCAIQCLGGWLELAHWVRELFLPRLLGGPIASRNCLAGFSHGPIVPAPIFGRLAGIGPLDARTAATETVGWAHSCQGGFPARYSHWAKV